MVQSMENEVIFASMFEKELCGLQTTDLVMSICFKALAETLATVQAICMSGYPRLGFQTCKSEDEACKLRIINRTTDMTTNNGCYMPFGSELCSSSREATTVEEYSPSSSLQGPDTTVRVKNEEIREWLSVAKNKDDDDDDDDEEEDDDDDEDENDGNDDEEEGADEDDEGEEGLQGGPPGDQAGGDDEEEDEDDDDDDDGKGDEEDEEDEDEDGVEGEEDEDEEDEDEEDEDDEDETPEPPQKKRK